MQIDPNDYEGMVGLGNQNQGLQRQMQMAQMLRQGAPQPGGVDMARGVPVAQNGKTTALNALTQMGGMAMQGKMGQRMDANKMQQMRMLIRAMQQQGSAPGPVGPGMMPPGPRRPGMLGGQPDPMYDLEG